MGRKFDRFMLHVGAGTNEKLAILTDGEYRAHISGILAVAATAPIRGRLLVGEMEAEPVQVAKKAGVSPAVAEAAMEKMKKVGVLYRDHELDCWAVHDWEALNPEPKADPTGAERAKRYRARRGARHGTVTPPVTAPSRRDDRDGHAGVTPPEVEGEVEERENSHVEPFRLDAAREARAQGKRARDELRGRQRQNIFDTWKEVTGRTGQTVFSPERRRLIDRALDAYPFEDVLAAVKGWRNIAHNRGENSTSTVYDELRLLLRDAEHIERFRDAEIGARRTRAAVQRRYLTATELKEIRDRGQAA